MTDLAVARPRAHRTHDDSWWRLLLRGLGQLLITLGVVLLLFVVYELYITGFYTAAAQRHLEQQFAENPSAPSAPAPHVHFTPPAIGDGIAIMYVPRFGKNWHMVVVQGTTEAALQKGPGHYTNTSCGCRQTWPGQRGNFAVAGHRTTYLHPFWAIDSIRPGDQVVIETHQEWLTYTVRNMPKTPGYPNVPWREIVDPTDVSVSYPVPDQPDPNKKPTLRLLTMTSCNPRFSAAQRYVVHALLTDRRPLSQGRPPALTAGT